MNNPGNPDTGYNTLELLPDEYLDACHDIALRANQLGDQSVREILRVVLAGKYLDNQNVRHNIMMKMPEIKAEDVQEIVVERRLEQLIGISNHIPVIHGEYEVQVPFGDELVSWRQPEFIYNHEIQLKPDGPVTTVSIGEIPNCQILSGSVTAYFMAPNLYVPGGLRYPLLLPDRSQLYELCWRPALIAVKGQAFVDARFPKNILSYMPGVWESEQWAQVAQMGSFEVNMFVTTLLEQAAQVPIFKDAFIVQICRPDDQPFRPLADSRDAWSLLEEHSSLDWDQMKQDKWMMGVSLRVSQQGKVVFWKHSGLPDLLHNVCLPKVPANSISDKLNLDEVKDSTRCSLDFLELTNIKFSPYAHKLSKSIYQITTSLDLDWDFEDHIKMIALDAVPYSTLVPTRFSEAVAYQKKVKGLLDDIHTRDTQPDGQSILTVWTDLKKAKGMFTNFIPSDTTVACIDSSDWWEIKHWRVTAAAYIIHHMGTASRPARITAPGLALTAVALFIIRHALFLRRISAEEKSLRDNTAMLWSGQMDHTENEIEEIFSQDEALPMVKERGMFFVADIHGEEDTLPTYRLVNGRHPDTHMLLFIYDHHNIASLYSAFSLVLGHNMDGENNQISVGSKILTKTIRQKDHTTLYSDVWSAAPVSLQTITIRPQLVLAPHFEMRGYGTREREIATFERLFEPLNVSIIVNKIWVQFARDVFMKIPTLTHKPSIPFSSWSAADLRNVRPEVFQEPNVPLLSARFLVVNGITWQRLFETAFPLPLGKQPSKLSHFQACTYYQAWADVMNRLTRSEAAEVRNKVRAEFNKFHWFPYGSSGGMWTKSKEDLAKPEHIRMNDFPAKYGGLDIAANPKLYHKDNIYLFIVREYEYYD